MVGKWRRDTSFVTATPSTVTSSSAAFGRWAFGIGQPRRDRRGRTDIVKGRSVRSGGNVLTTLSCSASGIFAICCDLTRPTTTRLARIAFCLPHFSADFIICTCVFDFGQAQVSSGLKLSNGVVCDEEGRTGIPGIFAAGDVAAWLDPFTRLHERHEHWTAAREQARIVAQIISGGVKTPWRR